MSNTVETGRPRETLIEGARQRGRSLRRSLERHGLPSDEAAEYASAAVGGEMMDVDEHRAEQASKK